MSNPSLSKLYQSVTSDQTLSARALIDAETAVRAARGRVVPHERDEVATALAGSAAHADLVRFLSALEPASAELAHGLARGTAAHENRGRGQRGAQARPARRGWQWGAVAASFIAAIALFVSHELRDPAGLMQAAAPPPGGAASFDGRLDDGVAHQRVDDRIFLATTGDGVVSDRIFMTQAGG